MTSKICKTIAILQSSYIPWKGYFDLINMVDEFILYDTVQFTKNDWRNRNIIKTDNKTQWLTIPVNTSGKFGQKIYETIVSDHRWITKHCSAIRTYYSRATYFDEYFSMIQQTYEKCLHEDYLSTINYLFIMAVCKILGIKTSVKWSTDYEYSDCDDKTMRLIQICKSANATQYISGPSASSYIDKSMFNKENIKLSYIDYSSYPIYNQLHENFIHQVSILDLIFNEGPNAYKYLKSFINNNPTKTQELG